MLPIIRNAIPGDIDTIHEILLPYAREELILARTKDDIAQSLHAFYVAAHNSHISGVISYYDYGDRLKEVRSLAVRKSMAKSGIGSLLLKHLISELSVLCPEPKIFVLTYSPVFFIKNGFVEVPRETLPEKIWKDCDHCKNRHNCGETALIFENNK